MTFGNQQVIDREDLNILGRRPFLDWEDFFYSPKPNKTYVLMHFTEEEMVPLKPGYYVAILNGNHSPKWAVNEERDNLFTCTSAKFFTLDPDNYCGTTAHKVVLEYFKNLREGIHQKVEVSE